MKAIANDRGFSLNIMDCLLCKSSKVRDFALVNNELKNVIVLLYFPKISTQISRILNKFSFEVVFSPINKVACPKLKDPVDSYNIRGI